MKTSLITLVVLFSFCATAVAVPTAEDDYILFRMTNGAVIQMKTGEKGDAVRLLKNPQTMTIGHDTIPYAPAHAVWAPVPDSSYQTTLGTTFVIHDSRIVSIIDRLGRDVTDPR